MAMPERKPEEQRPEEWPQLRAVKREEEEEGSELVRETAAPMSGIAIAGLIISIVSVIMPAVVALFTGATGATLGGLGLAQIRRGERSGSGIARGAIIAGGIVVGLAIAVLVMPQS